MIMPSIGPCNAAVFLPYNEPCPSWCFALYPNFSFVGTCGRKGIAKVERRM